MKWFIRFVIDYFVFFAVVAFLVAGIWVWAGVASAEDANAPDMNEPIARVCSQSACEEIYSEFGTGIVRYRIIDSSSVFDGSVVLDRVATDSEILTYIDEVRNADVSTAVDALNTNVEIGENWVSWLRTYSEDLDTAADGWSGFTDNQRAVRDEIMYRKNAKVMSGIADLLVTLGY